MNYRLTLDIAHPDHGYALAYSLSASDQIHLRAVWKDDEFVQHPGPVLAQTIEDCHQAFTICDEDNRLLGIWGHDHWDPVMNIGRVWLLSTDELFEDHLRELTYTFRREIVPALLEHYTALSVVVRSKNQGLLRWMQGAGFGPIFQESLNDEGFTLLTIGFPK